jgi:hypothetical protein
MHLDDTTDTSSSGIYHSVDVPDSGWFDVDIASDSSESSVRSANLIGLVVAGFDANASTLLYVDSITTSTGVVGPWQFASSGAPFTYAPDVGTDPSDISGSVGWLGN